ncbi:ran guanine nucleotide release factor-like [Glandiceps talaboti]
MFNDHQLYGGAMTVVLPVDATDVSDVREVPDNQEVFTHPSTDQSIIVEIVEYQHIENQNAPGYHFQDIAESNSSLQTQIMSTEQIPMEQLAMKECESVWFLDGKQSVSKFNEQAHNIINVHLALFRLPQFSTDILMTFNDPVTISAGSSSHVAAEVYNECQPWTLQQFKQCIATLTIKDNSLFGE